MGYDQKALGDHVMKTLWFDGTHTRFFLIPDSYDAPPGTFMINTITDQHRKVDFESLALFEITHDEAQAWLDAQLDAGLRGAKHAVDAFILGQSNNGSSPPDAETGPGVRLFSTLTGESADAIATDPTALARGLRQFGGDLKAIVADAFGADASKRETAKQRMQDMQDLVRQHGLGKPAKADEERQHEAGSPEADAKPDPGEVFRQRLHTILKDAVGRLEALANEALPMDKDKPDGGSGASNRI